MRQFGSPTTLLLCLLLIAVQHTARAFDLLDLFRAPPLEVRIANALEKGRENHEVAARFAAKRLRRYQAWMLRQPTLPTEEQTRNWLNRESAGEFWSDKLTAIDKTDSIPNYGGGSAATAPMTLGGVVAVTAALLALALVQIRRRRSEQQQQQRQELLPASIV